MQSGQSPAEYYRRRALGVRMQITKSGPLWALAGFILGAALAVAILGRYHQFGQSPSNFTLLDRFSGKVYHCYVDECEVIPIKEK